MSASQASTQPESFCGKKQLLLLLASGLVFSLVRDYERTYGAGDCNTCPHWVRDNLLQNRLKFYSIFSVFFLTVSSLQLMDFLHRTVL